MANATTSVGSFRLPHLDYDRLDAGQRRELVELVADMKKVRQAVTEGAFESLVTVDNALHFLSEKAARLGSELPESFVREIREDAVTRSLERSESYPQVVLKGDRLLQQARISLSASDEPRYRFFSGQARDYYEKHRLPAGELDRLEAQAAINPFFNCPESADSRPAPKTIDPFE